VDLHKSVRAVLERLDLVAKEVFVFEGDLIKDASMVCGAVACVPWVLKGSQDALRGQPRTAETSDKAAWAAVVGAKPLHYNHFKLPLMENLVRRAIREA
jgi:xanthine dehydrogenase YagS FAD-binding subunit